MPPKIEGLKLKEPEVPNQMRSLCEWLHESVAGKTLEIVHITDLNKTVIGLKDSGSSEVFIVGNMHDLTFILHGNEKRDR